jgi:2-dehydropantoate 2-reductase
VLDIIGGGAIGLSIAARLALSGTSVRVWTRTRRQAERILREGIAYESAVEPLQHAVASVDARHTEELQDEADLLENPTRWVLLAVKQTDAAAAGTVACIRKIAGRGIPVICLQNGIGHMEKLRAACPGIAFLEGITTEGALRQDERTVRLTGSGQLWLAEDEGDVRGSERQKMLLELLDKAGIKSLVSKTIKDQVYAKLLVNAVINPLTALFGVKNGELPQDETRYRLMRGLYEESIRVLSADADYSPTGSEWERILDVCRLTAANTSSMLADIRAGRPTEIAAINGGIVRLAQRFGISAPMNEAAVAWITALEEHGMERGG